MTTALLDSCPLLVHLESTDAPLAANDQEWYLISSLFITEKDQASIVSGEVRSRWKNQPK